MLFGYKLPYAESIAACEEFHGKIVSMGDLDRDFYLKERISLEAKCSNKIWLFSEENKITGELIVDIEGEVYIIIIKSP